MLTCCNIPLSLRDVEVSIQDPDMKTSLIHYEREFSKNDIRSLYFVTISMIVNVLVLLFIIAGMNETAETKRLIIIECIFMICFALGNSLVRIWNLKFYMLQPVLTIWKQFNGIIADKWMFFWAVFFGFSGVVLMIGVIISLYSDKFVLSIILTCIDCAVFIFTSLLYRLHVGVYIGKMTSCAT
jgi:hypothetical protein